MGGRAIRIFLADGTPTGLRTAELGLSTCKVVVAPRVALEALSRRAEARKTGVYVLVGYDADHPGRRVVYIGEGDEVFVRVRKHDDDKDFWDQVLLFVSKDENLTKAHVRYLEARMISLATEAKRATVMNATAPDPTRLPEPDQAEMEESLEHVQMLASTLGLGVFETSTAQEAASDGESEVRVQMSGGGYEATAVVRKGEIIVLKDSLARTDEAPSLSKSSKALRAELIDSGVLEPAQDGYRFAQNFAFGSASSAAQVVNAANVNGRRAWKLPDGRSLADWQDSHIEDS